MSVKPKLLESKVSESSDFYNLSDGFKRIFADDRKDRKIIVPVVGYGGHRRGDRSQNYFGKSFRDTTIQSKCLEREFRPGTLPVWGECPDAVITFLSKVKQTNRCEKSPPTPTCAFWLSQVGVAIRLDLRAKTGIITSFTSLVIYMLGYSLCLLHQASGERVEYRRAPRASSMWSEHFYFLHLIPINQCIHSQTPLHIYLSILSLLLSFHS